MIAAYQNLAGSIPYLGLLSGEGLAQAAIERAVRSLPEGLLDIARLGVLADALEDAGCTDASLLGHLRGPGPHCRGCWAVDLLLGRS